MDKKAIIVLTCSSIASIFAGFLVGKSLRKKPKYPGKLLVVYSEDQIDPHLPNLYLIIEDETAIQNLKNGDEAIFKCTLKSQ